MKTLMTSIAVIMAATTVSAADLMRTNVPAASGSVPGFFVSGAGYFVEAGYADRATVDATVLPAGVNSKDLAEVEAYLASAGINATPILRGDQTERDIIDDVLVVTTSRAVNGGW